MPKTTARRPSVTTVMVRGLVLFGVLGVLASAFAFPAALAWRAGAGWWLALTIGLLAFPGLALSWHALAELRRRGRGAPGRWRRVDRLALRTAITCVLVLGVVGVGWGRGAWRAVEHSKTRIELAAIGSTGLDAAPIAALDPAVLALVPPEVTVLLAVPDPLGVIDRELSADAEARDVLVDDVRETCDVDLRGTSIVAGGSATEFFVVVHAPGLDLAGLRCIGTTRAGSRGADVLADPAVVQTPIVGGVRLQVERGKSFTGFVTDAGAVVITSPGWAEAMQRRIAGRGAPLHLERFGTALARIEAQPEVDLWAVTTDVQPHWVESSWYLGWRGDALTAGGTIVAADAEAAAAVAESVRGALAAAKVDMKAMGLDLGEDLGVDIEVTGAEVSLSAHTNPVALFWSIWTSGMMQAMAAEWTGAPASPPPTPTPSR